MKRQEFIDDVTTYDELYEIDLVNDLCVFQDHGITDEECWKDRVYSEISYMANYQRDFSLFDIKNFIGDCDYIRGSYAWYDCSGYVSLSEAGLIDGDCLFDEIKQEILEIMDDRGFWDEEEEDPEILNQPLEYLFV